MNSPETTSTRPFITLVISNLPGQQDTDLTKYQETVLVLRKDDTLSTTLELDGNSYKTTFTELERINKVYQPGYLKATITLSYHRQTPPSQKKLYDALLGKYVTILHGGKETSVVDFNYYIHQMDYAILAIDKVIQLTLHIYSLDNKLRLRPYCQSYVAKRLGQEILQNALTGNGCFAGTGLKANVKHMNRLAYLKQGSTESDELIQPYLVQYNETFYDFLVRTANRCGEFLYFKEGTLYIGVPLKQQQDITRIGTEDITQIRLMSSDPYEDNFGKSISPISRTATDTTNKANDTALTYDFEIGRDEWLVPMPRNGYDSAEWVEWKDLFDLISQALNRSTLEEKIYNYSVNFISKGVSSEFKAANKKKSFNEKYFDEEFKKGAPAQFGTIDNVDYRCEFGTIRTEENLDQNTDNLYLQFYSTIRERERYVSRHAIGLTLKAGVHLNLAVGDQIATDYSEDTYLITEIRVQTGKGNSESIQTLTAVPFYLYQQEKESTLLAYPPLNDATNIRSSAPQIAYIADTSDPMSLGRVRIRYPWQTEKDTPSPWIRMTSPYATDNGGMRFCPNKGDEVLVDYQNGNVERPYVAGVLYSGKTEVPENSATITTRNGHSITFSEGKGAAGFLAGMGLNFLSVPFLSSYFPGVSKAYSKALGELSEVSPLAGGITLSDTFGLYSISMSTDKRAVKIDSPFGTVNVNAFTGISISAPNGDISIEGKNISLKAGNTITIESGTYVKDKKAEKKRVKENMAKAVTKTLTNQIKNNIIDLSGIRTIIEAFLHPVNGTLSITSNRYLMMQAGKGKTQLPESAYELSEPEGKTRLLRNKTSSDQGKAFNTLKYLCSRIAEEINGYEQKAKEIGPAQHAVEQLVPKGLVEPTLDTIIDKALADDTSQVTPAEIKCSNNFKLERRNYFIGTAVPIINNYIALVRELVTFTKWKDRITESIQSDSKLYLDRTMLKDEAVKALQAETCSNNWWGLQDGKVEKAKLKTPCDIVDWDTWVKASQRNVSLEFIKLLFDKKMAGLVENAPIAPDQVHYFDKDGNNWAQFIEQLESEKDPSFFSIMGQEVLKTLKDISGYNSYIESKLERNGWTESKNGQILMSDKSGYMLSLDGTQLKQEIVKDDITEIKDFLKQF